MKTLKMMPLFLVGGALMMGGACTSTSPESGTSTAATAETTAPATNAASSADVGGANANSAGTDAAADATAFMNTFATMQDPVFLMNAASSNMLEIQTGQMAAQKASNPEVRQFAQKMVSHHMQANQELRAVAAPLGVKMPTVMLPVHQAMAEQLMNKSGKNFDETYMDLMEAAHKLDVAMFEAKSGAAESPNVQSYAANKLPVLRAHQEAASALEKKVD